MSLKARLVQIEKHLPQPSCDLCGGPSGRVKMTLDMGEVEDYDPLAPENRYEDEEEEGTTPVSQSDWREQEPDHPLIAQLREENPGADTLRCPGCGRVIFRRLSLHTPRIGEREHNE